MPETNWPAGVIARYLTVGGGAVELFYEDGEVHAACQGERCTGRDRKSTGIFYHDGDEIRDQKIAAALPPMQRWAQSHAEKCRAMPRPAA